MELRKIIEILDAEILCCGDLITKDIKAACGSDLLSDVLAFTKSETLLITGLINRQVIRTAEVADVAAICFVRGKKPDKSLIEEAIRMDIPLLRTEYHMYGACGKLFMSGLRNGHEFLED